MLLNCFHVVVQLGGYTLVPLETRTKKKVVEIESSLGSYLSEPPMFGRRKLGAAGDDPWNVKHTPEDELDKRIRDKAREDQGNDSLAASKLGLKALPPSADDVHAEMTKERREKVDVVLGRPATVFLPDAIPVDDKDTAQAMLTTLVQDKSVENNTASAKRRAAELEVCACVF